VFSGMLGVTFFGILLTPVFYVLLRSGRGGRSRRLARVPSGGSVSPLAAPAAGHSGDGHA